LLIEKQDRCAIEQSLEVEEPIQGDLKMGKKDALKKQHLEHQANS
jgi:hypothetical protein